MNGFQESQTPQVIQNMEPPNNPHIPQSSNGGHSRDFIFFDPLESLGYSLAGVTIATSPVSPLLALGLGCGWGTNATSPRGSKYAIIRYMGFG